MKLRNKTLLIISTTLVGLILIIYVLSRLALMSGFLRVEKDNTIRNVTRVQEAIADQIDNLQVKISDWALWDDTYKFIDDHNSEYIESNLTDESLSALQLDLMLFIDKRGNIVVGREITPQTKDLLKTISEDTRQAIYKNKSLVTHQDPADVISGLILLKSGPMMVVSMPILTSSGEGPVNGTLIFGKRFDLAQTDKLANMTKLLIQTRLWNEPEDLSEIKKLLSPRNPIIVKPSSGKVISGYTFLPDINDNPLLMIKVDIKRDIYRQGRISMIYIVLAIVTAGIIFGMVIMGLLRRMVINRLTSLDDKFREIGETGDMSHRVEIRGNDEITSLSQSMNNMMASLEESQKAIKKYNSEIKLLMETIPSGLMSLDENYKINPAYSNSTELILGMSSIAGMDICDVLRLPTEGKDRQKLTDYLDVLNLELLPEEELRELNPFDELLLERETGSCWITLKYSLIHRPYDVNHILVVIEDITAAKELEAKVQRSEKENLQLKAIAENPDLFREFIVEIRQILKQMENKLAALSSPDAEQKALINEIFRGAHTIKGLALSFGMAGVSDIAGQMENSLSELRESGTLSPVAIEETKKSFGHLMLAVAEATDGAKKILGAELGEDNNVYLKIPLEDLKLIMGHIKQCPHSHHEDKKIVNNLKDEIMSRLLTIKRLPAKKGLARSLKIVPDLVKRLNKNILFNFVDNGTCIDCEVAGELNTSLVHLIRNAFDHGIETEQEARIELGKPEQGTVTLEIEQLDGHLNIRLSDDGKGLDIDRIREKALAKGLVTKEEAAALETEDWFQFIFRAGFSTATEVTDVSGRGVGMDAVYASINEKLGGKILVNSVTGQGTTFTIIVPTR